MKKTITLLLIALANVLPAAAHAQQNFWEPCGGPVADGITHLILHPDGDIFAGSSASGIYRSSDGGETWERVLDLGSLATAIRDMAVNAQGHVFASASDLFTPRLYRSKDKGANWEKILLGSPDVPVICLAVNAQDQLLAGTAKGIYRSFDDGDTWLLSDVRLDSLLIQELSAGPDGQIFAGTKTGLYRSAAAGNSWDKVALNAEVHTVAATNSGLVFAAADSSIYRSADNGDSWEPLGWNFGRISVLAFHTGGQALAGNAAGLFKSSDSGNSWQPAGLFDRAVYALAHEAGNTLLAGTSAGVFVSSDNTSTWFPANRGLGNTYVTSFSESPDGALYAGTRGTYFGRGFFQIIGSGVYRSPDGGNSWENVLSEPHVFSAVHVTPSGHILAQRVERTISRSFFYLHRSADQGVTWGQVDFVGQALDFVNNAQGHVFACAPWYESGGHGSNPGGIYKSADNGLSWDSVLLESGGLASYFALAINAQGDLFAGRYAPDDTIQVIRSTDGGHTWAPASGGIPANGGRVFALAIDKEGRLFTGKEYGGLYRSESNGDTWESLDADWGNLNDLAVNAEGHIFAATSYGVFFSADHGETWDTLNTGVGNTEVNVLIPTKSGRLFAGTNSEGVFRSAATGTAVKELPGKPVPADALGQIYPNPLREYANIPFSIGASGVAKLAIYDATGRELRILFGQDFKPGNYEAEFRPGDLPAGVYFYSLITRNLRSTKRFLIIR